MVESLDLRAAVNRQLLSSTVVAQGVVQEALADLQTVAEAQGQ